MSKQRKFLHDLATPLSIASITARTVLREITQVEQTREVWAHQKRRIEKIVSAIEKIEEFHAQAKEALESDID